MNEEKGPPSERAEALGSDSDLGKSSATKGPSQLVRAAQQGDVSATESLFAHYRSKLYRVAQARLGSRRRGLEVSDVLQTTLRRAVRSLDTLVPPSDAAVDAWFLQILDNAILDQRRRQNTLRRGAGREALPLEQSDASGGPVAPAHPRLADGLAQVENDELAAGVWRLLGPLERALVRERVIEGSSWERVAQVIGAASGEAARKRFDLLRKKVQERLGTGFDESGLRSS